MFEQDPINRVTEGLPVAPSLEPALSAVQAPPRYVPVDRRVIVISLIAIGVKTKTPEHLLIEP